MGLFKKKATAAELGEHLASAVAMTIHIPIHEAPILDYLDENTPLDEASARFEVVCFSAIILDNAILANENLQFYTHSEIPIFYPAIPILLEANHWFSNSRRRSHLH